jgi:hypothetical protein
MRSALLAGLGVSLLVATIIVSTGYGSAPAGDDLDLSFFGVLFSGLWLYWILGAIIVLRADGHANGWLFAVSAAMTGTVFACYALGFSLAFGMPADPRGGWFNLVGAVLFTPANHPAAPVGSHRVPGGCPARAALAPAGPGRDRDGRRP